MPTLLSEGATQASKLTVGATFESTKASLSVFVSGEAAALKKKKGEVTFENEPQLCFSTISNSSRKLLPVKRNA